MVGILTSGYHIYIHLRLPISVASISVVLSALGSENIDDSSRRNEQNRIENRHEIMQLPFHYATL